MSNANLDRYYIDIFNNTKLLYDELMQKCMVLYYNINIVELLKKEQQRRIVPKFDDEENKDIDTHIKELVLIMTSKVRQCEDNIKKLKSISFNSKIDTGIKENMQISLAEKLRTFTASFRKNEEMYMKNYKELGGEIIDDTNKSSNKNTSTFLQMDEDVNILSKRDEEINTLLNSINDLACIFKDLQMLVQHQGTILDRIDYNIETALDNSKEAHKHLVKANEHMKGNCFRNITMVLIILIFIESILLIFKFIP